MNGGYVTLQYDGDGNRVAETANGTTTRYLVDDLNPTGYPQVVEELVNGAVTRQYTNGLERISENQSINGKWTPSFYGYDGVGNVRQLSNLAGTITDNYEYDAFGNMIVSTGSTPNNYLYRGEQYDATLGLQYLRARYYNPVTGRFLSKDPWPGTINDPASLHKYSYAESNPIAGRDPSGLIDVSDYSSLALISESSVAYFAGLPKVGRDVNCILYTAAATLTAISDVERSGGNLLSINVDYSDCGADAAADLGYGSASPAGQPDLRPPTKAGCSAGPIGQVATNLLGPNALISGTWTDPRLGIYAGSAVGGLFGPVGAFAGGIVGSMFGAGPTFSYVPSTDSLYIGVAGAVGVGLRRLCTSFATFL